MSISPSTRMTAVQIAGLDNENVASQNVGGLGSRLDAMQYNGVPVVTTGSVSGIKAVSYITAPTLASTTAVHAAITLPATGTTVVTTTITNPTTPRQITITGSASGITGTISLVGTDIADAALNEDLTAVDATTVTSTKAFKTITSITVPAKTNSSGDTIAVGTGAKVGFPIAVPQTTRVLVKNFDGATDAGTVTAGLTAALSVYAVSGTFNGVKLLELVFLT